MFTIQGTVRRGAVLAGVLLSAACSTEVMGPRQAPRTDAPSAAAELTGLMDALKSYFNTTVLARPTELAADITVSKTIGSDGGTVSLPEMGLELVVPRGAVIKNTTFTVTALAGKATAYEFGPHGMNFKKPLIFRQNSMYTVGWWNAASGGYFKSRDQVDTQNSRAKVDEAVPMTWDGSWMTFEINHFSGYLVSCA